MSAQLFNFCAETGMVFMDVFQSMKEQEPYNHDTSAMSLLFYIDELPETAQELQQLQSSLREGFDIDASVSGWDIVKNDAKDARYFVSLSVGPLAVAKLELKLGEPDFISFLQDNDIARIEAGDFELDLKGLHVENYLESCREAEILGEKNRQMWAQEKLMKVAWKCKDKPVIRSQSFGV